MSRITLKEVAIAAKVSVASVSNVLNGSRVHKVSPETAEHIRRVADELGYARNHNAAALKQGYSNMIWLLMSGLAESDQESLLSQQHPFFLDFLSGIEKGTSVCQLQFGSLRANQARDLAPLLNGPKPQGVITLGLLNPEVEEVVAKWDLPTLLVDQEDFFERYPANPHLCNYGIDDHQMGELALEHLLGLGHRNIVLLFGDLALSAVHRARFEGIKQRANRFPEPVKLTLIESVTSLGGVATVFEALCHELRAGASAVLAMSDIQAIGVYRMAQRAQLCIPQDFSLIGMDNLSLLDYLPYRLTTVSQSIVHRGYFAVQQLAKRGAMNPVQLALVEGETTAARR
ncbi:LacI family DNA-binding transcriptional regulator [Vibrio navarrensis]